jgi:hypothetical protein
MTHKSAEERAREIVQVLLADFPTRIVADVGVFWSDWYNRIAAALRERDEEVEALRAETEAANAEARRRDELNGIYHDAMRGYAWELAEAKAEIEKVNRENFAFVQDMEKRYEERLATLREELEASRAATACLTEALKETRSAWIECADLHVQGEHIVPPTFRVMARQVDDTLSSLPDSARRFLEQHEAMRVTLKNLEELISRAYEGNWDERQLKCLVYDAREWIAEALSDGGEGR